MKNIAVSISGGGMLGIGPLTYMALMEKDFGFHLANRAIAFAGTSTGAIIASFLAEGYTAAEGCFLFKDNLKDIFKKYPWYRHIFNWKLPIYDNSALKTILQCHLSGKCYEWRKPVYIPAYAMNWKSVEKVWDKGDDADKWEAVFSSTCAPEYFSAYTKDGVDYIDGGMWANNPVAILNAGLNRSEYRGNVKILEFNTGMSYPNTDRANKGIFGWGKYIIGRCIGATTLSGDYMARADIGDDNVLMLSPKVESKHSMDDITDEHVSEVCDIWTEYYNDTKADLSGWLEK